ncbi:MAG: GMC family oxidoreductase, partial [Thermodesulfobacteriota bacterium]
GAKEVFEYHSRNTNARIDPDGEAGLRHELSCTGCGCCPLGCRYDRKQTPLITFMPAAIENGLNGVGGNEVKVFKKAEVTKVLHEDGKVSGVLVSTRGGSLKIKARTVIVSCGAINSARLLMKSKVENPHLGKHLSLHPSPLVFALFEDEKIYSDWGVPMAASYTEYQFPKPGGVFPDGFGYILETIYSHPATTALTLPLKTMKERMKDYEKMASVAIILHDKPVGEIKNPDSLLTCLSYEMDEGDKAKLRHAVRTAAEIYLKAGAKEVFTSHESEIIFRSEEDLKKADDCGFEPGEILLASAHPQGGCRISSSRDKGVVDHNGRSHDIEGLFVSDASLYPTSLGVNPQLTTMAMGTKIGEHVAGLA